MNPYGRKGKPKVIPRAAASIVWRGNNDEILTFVFLNIPQQIVVSVMNVMYQSHLIGGYIVQDEQMPIHRANYAYLYKSAEVFAPNYQMLGGLNRREEPVFTEWKQLIQRMIENRYPCLFEWVGINKFLNM